MSRADNQILPLGLACYHAVRDYGGVPKIAAVFGESASTLQNKLCPSSNKSQRITDLDIEQILLETRDPRILDAICQPLNVVWLWGDDFAGAAGDMAMLDNVTELVKRTGELAGEIQAALADGKVDPDELRRMQFALYRLQQSSYGAVTCAAQFSE
ncbi:phage regulatory CII family protein [Motiliproteus sp.]|uniref:phage regulatory CII family protein n=1 Tax=Motiliproteus sp. TaxID=1898955 RepID=UPI003BAABCE4